MFLLVGLHYDILFLYIHVVQGSPSKTAKPGKKNYLKPQNKCKLFSIPEIHQISWRNCSRKALKVWNLQKFLLYSTIFDYPHSCPDTFPTAAWMSHIASIACYRCVNHARERSLDPQGSLQESECNASLSGVFLTPHDLKMIWFFVDREVRVVYAYIHRTPHYRWCRNFECIVYLTLLSFTDSTLHHNKYVCTWWN